MPLTGHGGAGDPSTWEGVHGNAIAAIESPGWNSRRALHFLIFGGVFDRFPNLKLVLTEQPGTWWSYTARDYDSVWFSYDADSAFRKQVPLLPSEYMAHNVYQGASFMSFEEAQDAVKHGYVSRVIWGRDYPHAEGTFQAAEFEGDPLQSPLALRDALHGSTADDALAMVGLNGVEAYGLDAERLAKIAEEIGAPSINELRVPPDVIPESHGFMAFRRHGAYS
jgi:predicted TIM-barrel fold metal-dependent hydrolase